MKRKRKILPYNPKLVPLARKLRSNSTLGEILLWRRLKNKQLMGYDFHRQKTVGNYIIDLFCPELLLAIEIDGASHRFNYKADLRRQQTLEVWGIKFLRFTEHRVRSEIDEVIEEIRWTIEKMED